MNDEEFTLELLKDIFTTASVDALGETLEALANALGVTQLQNMPIQEFYGRRKRAIAEHLVADYADTNPAHAARLKAAWEQVDQAQEQRREADEASNE